MFNNAGRLKVNMGNIYFKVNKALYSLYSEYLHSFTLYLIHFPLYIQFIQDTCIPFHFILFTFHYIHYIHYIFTLFRILLFLYTLSYSLSIIYSLYSGYLHSFSLYLIPFPLYIHFILWPNLKNLSGGLNLSRGLNMVGST